MDVVVDDATFPPRVEPTWLPAGLLAALMLLTLTASSFGAESQQSRGTLKWRAVGSNPSRGVASRAVYHSTRGRVSSGRFVDPAVKTVAYNEPSAERSVLNSGGTNIRLAQGNDDFNFGDELQRQFETPMVDEGKIDPPKLDDAPLPFGDLPAPQEDAPTLPADDPPVVEPPLLDDIESPAQPPAQPKFDPFDQPAPPAPREVPPIDNNPLRPSGDADDDDRRAKEREEAAQDCAEELANLRASNLTMVDIHIGRSGVEGEDYPYVCSIDDGIPLSERCWAPVTYTWKASALCHKPLYFEQEQLERYGHSWGPMLQPVVSGAHFFSRLPVLPYAMGLKAPNECVYALGHYRPGSCAPYMIPAVPFTWRAAIFQGGAWTGAAFIFP